jgi:aspartyl-tRNA(Asn)/glutamyl-tRNA(Gln) amidotransferase subunit C
MPLSREVVRRVAMLARLELGEEDEAAVTEQLDHILQHFETLAALDTANVAPTAHVVEMAEAYRDDAVTNPPAVEALRANAPARDGDFFKVPKIIE